MVPFLALWMSSYHPIRGWASVNGIVNSHYSLHPICPPPTLMNHLDSQPGLASWVLWAGRRKHSVGGEGSLPLPLHVAARGG